MRIIFEDRKGQKAAKRVERLNKRAIGAARRAKQFERGLNARMAWGN